MANRLNVLVGAVLDSNVTKNLNKELAELELRDVAVNLTLSKKTLTSFQNAISKAAQEIFDSISLSDDAIKKMGQNIGKGIAKGFEESGESATKYFKEIEKQSGKTADKVIKDSEKITDAQKKQYKISARRASDVTSVKSVWKNIETKVPYASLKWQKIDYDKLDLSALSENARKDIEKIQKELLEVKKEKKQISDEIDKLDDELAKRLKLKRTVKLKDESSHISHEEMMEYHNKNNDLIDSLGPLDKKIWDLSAKQHELFKKNAESILVTQEKRVQSSAKFIKAKKEEASIVEEISKKEIESANKQIAAQEAIERAASIKNDDQKNILDANKAAEEYARREGKIIAGQIERQRKLQKEHERYRKIDAKAEERALIDEGNRIIQAQKAEEKAQDKLYSQKLKLNSGIEEQKRQELVKTQDAYEKLDKTIDDLYKHSGNNKIFGQEQAKEIDRYEAGLKEVEDILKKENVQYSELIYAQKKLTSLQNSASSFTAELNKQVVTQDKLTQSTKKQIQALSAQHEIKATRLTSQYGDLFDEEEFNLIANHYLVAIERELKKIRPEANRIDETIQEWKRHVGQFETELRASHKQAKRIKDEIEILDSSLGRFIQFYGFGELFRATKTGITEMVSAVSTLDASLVELKKVSDETDATYDKFMDNAADRAKELGVAMSDYIDSVTNFARSGFDFSEAQEIAKTANIMQMVSEQMSADEASEYLISIIRGFNIEASKSIDIVNALNNVDRRSQSEMPGQTLSFYRRTSRNGRPIPRIRLFYVMCA